MLISKMLDSLKNKKTPTSSQNLSLHKSSNYPYNTMNERPSIMPEETWRHLAHRRNDFLKSLEGLRVKEHVVSTEELEKLIKVKKIVDVFLKEHEAKKVSSDTEGLKQLINILDRITLWKTKFSTECSGGAGDEIPLQEYNPEMDSLYYTTPSGATLRLKTAALYDGRNLRAAIQPITEKIAFEGPHGELIESPRIGYNVREYFSPSFMSAMQEGNTNRYTPELRIYRRADASIVISHSKNERTGQESFGADHDGDRVNKIFEKP